MGITVVSSPSMSTPGTGAAAPLPAEAGALDFLALLTQQISGQSLGLAATGTGVSDGGDTGEDPSTPQDIGVLLGETSLMPFPPASPATLRQEPSNGALAAGMKAEQGHIPGVIGQLELAATQGRDEKDIRGLNGGKADLQASSNSLLPETANFAAEPGGSSGNISNFAASLASQSAMAQSVSQHQHRVDNAPAQAQVNTPLHDGRWAQEFSEKVVWLARNDQQMAQLNVNPPQLGPMQITLNLNGDQATAMFASPHAEVRQAISDAMPQLREMLAGAGINLGQANVGSQMPQQNSGTPSQAAGQNRSEGDTAILRADQEQSLAPLTSNVRGGRGMVDLFA